MLPYVSVLMMEQDKRHASWFVTKLLHEYTVTIVRPNISHVMVGLETTVTGKMLRYEKVS